MIKKINLFALIVFVLLITLSFTKTDVYSQEVFDDENVIIGKVVATEFDKDDNVTEVAISVTITPDDTTDEEYVEYYSVVKDEKGQELLKLVGKIVEATGTVEFDEDDNMFFTVKEYIVLKEEKE